MPHDRAPGLEDERPLMARRMRATLFAAVVSLGMTAVNAAGPVSDPPLLPMPANVSVRTGAFTFDHAQIEASGSGERAAAERLRSLLTRSRGPKLGFARRGQIRFHRDSQIVGDEAYRILVTPKVVDVAASTDAGLYYGAETLW